MSSIDIETKQRVALFALNQMLKGNHFDICTVREVGDMLGVPYRGEAYEVLSTLHCIDYAKMPKDIRDMIPELIQQCLGVEPMKLIEHIAPPLTPIRPVLISGVLDVNTKPKSAIQRLLGR
jgi:hypothetical protein